MSLTTKGGDVLRRLTSALRRLARFFRRRAPRRRPGQVFEFWDGGRWRAVDSLTAWAIVADELGDDLESLLVTVTGGTATEREAVAAARRVGDAATVAFNLAPFADGTGLTLLERVELVTAFLTHFRAALRAGACH